MLTKTLFFLVSALILTTITNSAISGLFNTVFAQEEQQNQSNSSNSSSPIAGNTQNVGQEQAPTQQQVPEQKRYNAEVTKILDQMNAPLNKTLPPSTTSTLGTEPENKNNWIMALVPEVVIKQ